MEKAMRSILLVAALSGVFLATVAANAAQPTVAELVAGLNSPDEAKRLDAIAQLGHQGEKAAEAVPALAALLKDPSPKVRAYTALTLGEIGAPAKPAVPALVLLVADSDKTVRLQALGALARIKPGPRVTVPLFLKLLKESDPAARQHALNALADAGEKAVPFLLVAMKHEKATYWCCLVLRQIGPAAKDAVPALTELIGDKRPEVRREAILALAHIGDAAAPAVPQIAKALDDEHARTAATFALGHIGKLSDEAEAKIRRNVGGKDQVLAGVSLWTLARLHPEDRKLLVEATNALAEELKSKDPLVRKMAARALGDLKPAPEILRPAMERVLQGADDTVIYEALDALAGMGPAAVPRLTAALKHEKFRPYVVYMLGQIGAASKPAVPELAKLLNDENPDVRHETAIALAKIGPNAKEAVPALAKALEECDGPSCCGAAYALGRIGDPEAVPALMKAVESKDETLAAISAWALVQIQPKDAPTAAKALPQLIRGLGDSDPKFRHGAAAALKQLGPLAKPAIPALKKALKDDEASVRTMAEEALAAIGG
jgi:HEAT repeat protein